MSILMMGCDATTTMIYWVVAVCTNDSICYLHEHSELEVNKFVI